MEIKRKQRTPVYKNIVREIRQLIRQGKLSPGDQLLPERQLAETLGVSRPALREGLTALASMGLIEIRPGGGAYIREANLDGLVEPLATIILTEQENVFHLLEVRRILEAQIVRLATVRATDADLVRIREAAVIAEKDMSQGFADESDTYFHICLAEATHNPVLIKIMSMLSGLMREAYGPSRRRLLAMPEMAQLYAEQHYRVYEALRRKDAETAAEVIDEHLETVEQGLVLIAREDAASNESRLEGDLA